MVLTVLAVLESVKGQCMDTCDPGLQAELWASESADRGSSKLSIESALLLDTKLRREVAHAFEKHQLPGTGRGARFGSFQCVILAKD